MNWSNKRYSIQSPAKPTYSAYPTKQRKVMGEVSSANVSTLENNLKLSDKRDTWNKCI